MNKKIILIGLLAVFGAVLVSGCIGESESNESGNTLANIENGSINQNTTENSGPEPIPAPESENTHVHNENCNH